MIRNHGSVRVSFFESMQNEALYQLFFNQTLPYVFDNMLNFIQRMVNKCVMFGCKSGYNSTLENVSSFFRFH